MIKETDASKNDERRVKNKLNPLTHKRKGETRTMSIQGTKHWQLGMFFVVSLMLMVGLFANIALAHDDMAMPRERAVDLEPRLNYRQSVMLKSRQRLPQTPWLT